MLLTILLVSCNETRTTEVKEINIDVNNISLEPAFTDYKIINLELTEESALNDLTKVVFGKDRIFVLCMGNPVPFIFDKDGKFLSKLNVGRGPGDIIFCSDIQVKNDTLLVIDNYRKIKAYSLNGEYYKDMYSLSNPIFSFLPCDNGVLLLDPNHSKRSDWTLSFLSNDGLLTGVIKKDEHVKDIAYLGYEQLKEKVFSWPFSDTIYSVDIKNGEINPQIIIDFNGLFINNKEFGDDYKRNPDCMSMQNDKYVSWISDVVVDDENIFFSYLKDKRYFVKYKNGKSIVTASFLPNFPEMKNKAIGAIGKDLIFSYQPYEFNSETEMLDSGLTINNENEESNPFLVIVNPFD